MRPDRARTRLGITASGSSRPSAGGPPRAIRLAALLSVILVAAAWLPSAAEDPPTLRPNEERPVVVVTTEVLGALVRDLVGDRATVEVLMPSGADPHTWQPSARDVERIFGADLVVANGLSLEEGLHDILERAAAEGVPVFQAADHVTVRFLDETDHAADDHAHGLADPHFWLDPLAVRDAALALAADLQGRGVDVSAQATDLAARLEALDAEVRGVLEALPPERRKLVTGHDSLGYLARRYDLELVGTVIPGLSTQAEISARELAALTDAIRQAGVPVVFTEIGTPASVADAVAAETGARLVELRVVQLPEDGSYFSLVRELVGTIAEALAS